MPPATSAAFHASLAGEAPAEDASPSLAALWWAHRGDWDRAHGIVQDAPGPEAAWVHAYLHRLEGDRANAGYWYRRAGRPAADGSPADEWEAIVAALSG